MKDECSVVLLFQVARSSRECVKDKVVLCDEVNLFGA